jgi:CheY-like chemotaxis protein
MEKILIVDEDQDLLKSLKTGLNKMRQFEVTTAPDIKTAKTSLSKDRIAILVTVIDSPKIDGLELVAHMSHHHPSTPIIIMTDYGKPWFHDRSARSDFLYHIEKPLEIKTLASAIFVGLTIRDEGANFNGLAMVHLLPVIEVHRKSCKMKVESRRRGKGYLYFDDGILINAHYEELTGDNAAKEMATWNNLAIKFTDLPRRRIKKRIKTSLMELIGASWKKEDMTKGGQASKFTKQIIAEELQKKMMELNTINGFKAVGVLNDKGDVLDHMAVDDTLDFCGLIKNCEHVFAAPSGSKGKSASDVSLAFTHHSNNCVIVIHSIKTPLDEKYFIVGLTAPGGNWFFMKHKLERIKNKIAEKIS